ncbi:acetate kinase [Aliidongia dinghuensis]|uniref:Acetate kinase n=1 Tax=Aliidongia dinghuensis TaxID=1867774 RepID=A0A8J2YZM6_9PROT|nr:acetate/propionate family kinase [Aliidongia dinghuensis]GGF43719.1 acetate kinase [Aliidongia dinghuensis]
MREPILVLNAGSSSLKFAVFETAPDRSLNLGVHGAVSEIDSRPRLRVMDADDAVIADRPVGALGHEGAVAAIHEWFAGHVGREADFSGIGHRVVHGGTAYAAPVRIDETVLCAIEALIPLAPLHQPHHVAAIRAVTAVAPLVPQVACFDTAFHQGQPAVAQSFALPRALTAKGIRRFGFHGLSYEYISQALPEVAPAAARGRVVVAHLGNGASMCAIENGLSRASTMGFTAVDGLPMGTRTGALDPGVLLYLMQQEGMSAAAVQTLIYEQSGLLGVSGLSSDMRTLLASDLPAAREAIDLFVYRIGRELGSLAAALGGLDALVFTGGIGENAAPIRARVCRDARWLGVRLDEATNARNGPCISEPGSAVPVWVVPTNENLMIARHTQRVVERLRSGHPREAR